jgi:hypothetical protein
MYSRIVIVTNRQFTRRRKPDATNGILKIYRLNAGNVRNLVKILYLTSNGVQYLRREFINVSSRDHELLKLGDMNHWQF